MIYLVDIGAALGQRRVLAISDTGENLGGFQAATLAAAEDAIKAQFGGGHQYRSVAQDDPALPDACRADDAAVIANNTALAEQAAAAARQKIL